MRISNYYSCIIIFIIIAIIGATGACSSDSESNLESGWEKWKNGDYDSMDKFEKDAVDDFLDWSNDN